MNNQIYPSTFLAVILFVACCSLHAQETAIPTTTLGGPPAWPPYAKVEAVLRHWAAQHPERYRLEELGKSVEGRCIYAVTMTDPGVDDATKEHALVTALHAGIERGAATTVMRIIEWFLSDDPAARAILQKHVVIFLPLPDPDRYEKGQFTPIYTDWNTEGPLNPVNIPEAVYVQQVFDRFQPDVHADIHGVSLGFEKYIMFESSGTSYSNPALRPYHRDIVRQMDQAALEAGYPSDTGESDGERIFYGPGLAHMPRKTWTGQPRFYAATYLYYHFHTLISASEVVWEDSGLARHQRLLEIGNERWPGEYYPGYPNRIMMGNPHATLTAYGATAEKRRRSRIELWNRTDEFTFGTLDPAMEGQAAVFLATSAAADHYLEDINFPEVMKRLETHPSIPFKPVADFFQDWPIGQNAPHPQLYVSRRAKEKEDAPPTEPIAHGLSIKLRLVYPKAQIEHLQLNGVVLPVSETDGYLSWTARGCTYIQISLPPERLAKDDLFIVTCAYSPGESRKHWDTWRNIE